MTLLRAIHQIEITSRCNLKCAYCPSYRLPRPKMDMDMRTFVRSLEVASSFQKMFQTWDMELNLAGIGESTLHPQFLSFLALAREEMHPDTRIVLATNGLLVDEKMAQAMALFRPLVWVSLHRPEKAQQAIVSLSKHGILAGVSCDGALDAVNWAGQIDWPVTSQSVGQPCPWVRNGWGFVLSDGRISRCCFDASGAGVFASVWDDDLVTRHTSPYDLCKTCHLKVA